MEGFSKNTFHGVNSREKKKAHMLMTPSRLSGFFALRLQDICANFEELAFPIALIGCLGKKLAQNEDDALFTLRDWEGEGEVILELTQEMLEETDLRIGDYVKLLGVLRARLLGDVVVPRFEVVGVSAYQEEDEEAVPQISEARDTALLSILRDYAPSRHAFPEKSTLSLLLVALDISKNQQENFLHALGGGWNNRDLRLLSFSRENMAGWREACERADEDIFVLFGSEEGCVALEEPENLFPLARVRGHRIVILERAAHADVTDGKGAVASYLADRAFFSSLEAGGYLRQEWGKIWQKNEEERAQKEELDALRESLARLSLQPSHSLGRMRFIIIGIILGFLLFFTGEIIMNLMHNSL